MKDDYLWDRSGEPDPEIQKLEKALGRFAHRGEAPEFPALMAIPALSVWQRVARLRWAPALAVAGALLLAITSFALIRWSRAPETATGPAWEVQSVAGSAKVESHALFHTANAAKLYVGQTLVTDSHSKATITVADVGSVDIEPNSRLRLLAAAQGRSRLSLERGTIHAFIWASPGQFAVDTPSAIAVDLGCAYTLQVDDSGAGLLRTTLGWVGFKLDGREAFIPAGAVCATRPKIGPGTPYFDDAPVSLRDELSKFDFTAGPAAQKNAELAQILNDARPRDALTVWHLLSRVDPSQRGLVYDRLASLVPPPAGVTRDGILQLDAKMLDLWWNELGLGDVSLWRTWERPWSHDKS